MPRNSDFVYTTLAYERFYLLANYEFIVSLVSSYVALCKIIIFDDLMVTFIGYVL